MFMGKTNLKTMKMKPRNIIGWILTVAIAALLLFSASAKLMADTKTINMAAHMGLSLKKFKFIGLVEIVSTLLFIFPRTGVLGTLLLAAYMGGAIATHMEHFMSPNMPVLIECVIFIAGALRFPELNSRFFGKMAS
jgi:hypothetical protein